MGSTSKRHKLPQNSQINETLDRISGLHDAVLIHILSFLPTKIAVASSVLSTRWRNLFASLPVLDFDYDAGLPPIFQRVLLMRNVAHIRKLRLSSSKIIDSCHVNAWISRAILDNVQELDLSVAMREADLLPLSLFSCKTLVVLKLGCVEDLSFIDVVRFFIYVPTDRICFPSLKILHLMTVEFVNDGSIERLFSGCPALEDLEMVKIGLTDRKVPDISISSATLKRLTIDCGVNYDYEMVVDAPNLEFFKYSGYAAKAYSLNNLNSLVQASIDVLRRRRHYETNVDYVIELLNAISNAKFLHLNGSVIEDLYLASTRLRVTFPNVTHLELGYGYPSERAELPDLLRCFSTLEVLVFPKMISWSWEMQQRMIEKW